MWKNKGFTLIEIITAVVIMAVLGIFGYRFLSTSVHTYSMMEKQKSLYDEAAMAMERISRELRDAESISVPASGASGSTLVTFTKSHLSPAEPATYTTITFELTSGILERTAEGTPTGTHTENLAEKVSTFTVARGTSPADEITITLTLQETTGESITLRSYIYPKNLDYATPQTPSGRNFMGQWEEDIQ